MYLLADGKIFFMVSCKAQSGLLLFRICLCDQFFMMSDTDFASYASDNTLVFTEQKQPPEVFYKKDALENFVKFTEKHLCQSLIFNEVAGLSL